MVIYKFIKDEGIILELDGKLDTGSVLDLQEALTLAFNESVNVTLDFKKIIYVSSAGLRVLFSGQRLAIDKNGAMKIVNVSEDVKEVLDMTGFSDILNIE